MTNATLMNQIDAFEKQMNYDASYMRAILAASSEAMEKFFGFMSLAHHRTAAPVETVAVARIVAARSEDCGPCLQITVDFAQVDGVSPDLIQLVLDRRVAELPPLLATVYQFAEAVCAINPEAETYRTQLEQELGHEAMVDLALAIATTRVFPTVKRGLGFATSCSKVAVKVA